MSIGGQTIERGTVEAYRMERGIKDPATTAAKETAENTGSLIEIAKEIEKKMRIKEAVFQ